MSVDTIPNQERGFSSDAGLAMRSHPFVSHSNVVDLVYLLKYFMKSSRCLVIFYLEAHVLSVDVVFFHTPFALVSGQKYPLPEGVGERHYSV